MTPTTPHPWAKELRALADGATILEKRTDEADAPAAWRGLDPYGGGMLAFLRGDTESHEFKIKPPFILVNGCEVPAPLTEEPETGTTYYTPDPSNLLLRRLDCWNGAQVDKHRLERGLVHLDESAAIAHSDAWMSTK